MLLSTAPLLAQTRYDVESDELEIFNREGRAVFKGNVRLWNDTGVIQCNRLEAFYVEGGDTIDFLNAYGDVTIERENVYAESNYAYHDLQNDTAVLQEDAYVQRENSEFSSDRMWIDLSREQIKMKNNVRGHLVQSSSDTGVDQ